MVLSCSKSLPVLWRQILNRFSEAERALHNTVQGDRLRRSCRITRQVCPVPESLLLLYPAVHTEAWKQKSSVYLKDIASHLPSHNSDLVMGRDFWYSALWPSRESYENKQFLPLLML